MSKTPWKDSHVIKLDMIFQTGYCKRGDILKKVESFFTFSLFLNNVLGVLIWNSKICKIKKNNKNKYNEKRWNVEHYFLGKKILKK